MPQAYIVGDSSPFLKRVLIPFWVIRIIIMLIQIAIYALLVAGLGIYKDDSRRLFDEYNTKLAYNTVLAVACVIMGITLLCLILDIVCIIKRARRTLSPGFFLGANVSQSLFYTVSFILGMIGARPNAITAVVQVIILLSFLGLLIYASVVFHQYRKGALRGNYAPAHNPESHKLVSTGNTGFPQSTPYGQDYPQEYPKATYYDGASQAYSGQAYAAPQPQQTGYEPNRAPNV
ncbi:pH-response regulator protein palF/prr-3 [Cladorrhinum sp. PSN332]|nr:pH-response regulator protein palF/prr-3 [Cladorrhinum sp. PSN332]